QITRLQEHSQRQVATGRVSGEDQIVRIGAAPEQPLIGVERVVKLRREPMLRGKTIIEGKCPRFCRQCDLRDKAGVRLRVKGVSAAMKIQDSDRRVRVPAGEPASPELLMHSVSDGYL